jgi:hypothetical protein
MIYYKLEKWSEEKIKKEDAKLDSNHVIISSVGDGEYEFNTIGNVFRNYQQAITVAEISNNYPKSTLFIVDIYDRFEFIGTFLTAKFHNDSTQEDSYTFISELDIKCFDDEFDFGN